MAEMRHHMYINMKGPWLLTKEQVSSLDKVIEDAHVLMLEDHKRKMEELAAKEYESLLADHKARMAMMTKHPSSGDSPEGQAKKSKREPKLRALLMEKANERVRNIYQSREKPSRRIEVRVDGDRKLLGESFEEIIKRPETASVRVTALKIELKGSMPYMSCELKLDGDGYLNLHMSPESEPMADAIFPRFRSWILTVQPPAWQRWWVNGFPWHWAIFFAVLWSAAALAIQPSANTTHIKDAHELLKNGVNTQNQARAVELLLSIASNYVPDNVHRPAPFLSMRMFTFSICAAAVFAVILSIKPPCFAIELGTGETTVPLWRRWVTFINGMPAYILLTIIIPKLKAILGL